MEFKHISVLLEEVLEGLSIRPDGLYVDGTMGGGGHSFHIAELLTQGGHLIGIDQDEEALRAAKERLSPFADRVSFVHDNYENMQQVVRMWLSGREKTGEISTAAGPGGTDNCGSASGRVNGILLDLGVSSYQLDNPERGFSYRSDAPLDMRMDQNTALSAREIVNTWSEKELARILREYGEEKMASRIAANIVRAREEAPLETTGQLVQIIERSIPMKMRERGGTPCKRTFQAIRIACNRELEVLEDSLDTMIDLLAP